ncbi:MAG: alpha/beta hydrolase [Candidatus Nitrosotenuis sp.]|nr:MAG: alpha/beta hydrolase [Candidatus Nitrosotenuis sp.]
MWIPPTVLGAGLMLAVLIALGRRHEARSIFQPSRGDIRVPGDYHPKPQDLFIDTGNGAIHGWFFAVNRDAPTILYIHGNADTIVQRLPVIKGYIGLGLNVFIYDPHGYGKSEGTAGKSNFVSDAFAAYRHLTEQMRIPPGRIVVLGQSLGGVPALRMANSEPVAGLILEGTFTSIRQMARDRYPLLPLWLLASGDFDNEREIRRLKIPLLIINGTADSTVAPYHSQRLFDIAPKPCEYIRIEGAGHTTMFETAPDIYYGAIARFVQSAVARRAR